MGLSTRHPYSRAFFLLLMGFVFLLSYTLVRPYTSVVLFSFVLALFFRPVLVWLENFLHRRKLSLLLTWLVILLVVLVPLVLVIELLISQIITMSRDLISLDLSQFYSVERITNSLNQFLSQLPGITTQLNVQTFQSDLQNFGKSFANYALGQSISLGTAGLSLFPQLVVFMVLATTFLLRMDDFILFLKKLSPLEKRLDDMYFNRILAMTRAMVKGTFVIALAQSICAGLFLYLFNVPYVLFWVVLMFFFSIIPLGAGLVTFPIGIFFLSQGNFLAGLSLILGTVFIVNNLDNFLRPFLVPKEASLHPALLLLGVLGGIRLFGLWGVIYGPVIMILLTTTLEIYLEQY